MRSDLFFLRCHWRCRIFWEIIAFCTWWGLCYCAVGRHSFQGRGVSPTSVSSSSLSRSTEFFRNVWQRRCFVDIMISGSFFQWKISFHFQLQLAIWLAQDWKYVLYSLSSSLAFQLSLVHKMKSTTSNLLKTHLHSRVATTDWHADNVLSLHS